MNILDLVIIALAAAAVVGGWRLGFLARASSWLGLAIGLVLAGRIAPTVVGWFDGNEPAVLLVVAATVLIVGALVGQVTGLIAGARLRVVVPDGSARDLDRTLGAVAGLAGVAIATWLLTPVLSQVRDWPADQVASSFVATAMSDLLPQPPNTLQSLAMAVGHKTWDDVIREVSPDLGTQPPPARHDLPPEVVSRAEAASVRVTGVACQERHEGSGFVAEGNMVITNAHVVAGITNPVVTNDQGESFESRLVVFDVRRDLAVLVVPGLERPSLPLGAAEEGDSGAVFGYPAGNDLTIKPYEVELAQNVEVPDLYNPTLGRYERQVYFISSDLQGGDSGAPLVNPEGQVIGVAFATSTDRQRLAFALTKRELLVVLEEGRTLLEHDPSFSLQPGPCLEPV